MAITAPPSITALPTPPDPNDRSTFNSRAYPWSVAQQTFGTQVGAVASNVYNNALEAEASATAAAASASTATTQANAALGHANTASGAATSAINAFDQFDDRYLGAKSSNPALDNDGNALVTGALYWNTIVPEMRVWTGTVWQVAAGSINASISVIREAQTAGSSQTIFNLSNTYSVGTNSLMVYRNGSRLLNSEYTETNANTVTLQSAATAGDELLFEIGVVTAGSTTTAALTTFSPVGGISAGNVQAAIAELDTEKQAALVSGTNIKTVNSQSLLGSGNISIGGNPSIVRTYAGPPTGTWSRAASRTGTYNQPGTTTVTVTITGHGLVSGDWVYLDFTSGTAGDAWFEVTVTGVDTFTVTRTSTTTSGNVTLHLPVVVTITSQAAHGLSAGNRAVLDFDATLTDASYIVRQVSAGAFQLDGSSGQVVNTGTTTITTQGSGSSGTVTFLSVNRTATWTKPAGLSYAKVTVTGGGGQAMSATSCGGAGSTAIKVISAGSLGATESVTVGRGGTEQMGNIASSVGTTGSTSSFGSHCSATGGTGGDGSTPSHGGGGTATGGDMNIRGGNGFTSGSAGAFWGSAPGFGGGGITGSGSGAFNQGGFGIVIVEEFY